MGADDLLLVAGEASGDLLGARLLSELLEIRPSLRPFGLGGRELERAGLEEIANSSEISVVGVGEVLRVLPRARQIFKQLLAEVDRRNASTAVLVDFPEFNLRLARKLKQRGVRVVYYVSPQLWAWRRGRARTVARWVDKMLVLFPFEVGFYSGYGVSAVHVGHPLVDEVPRMAHVWDGSEKGDSPYHVALLPGSRSSEVAALLPVMLESARRIAAQVPVRFTLIQAPTIPAAVLETAIAASGLEIELAAEDRLRVSAAAHLALCASGTATLEQGLLGTPMIVLYRLGWWSYLLGRMLVRLEHVSLVNLVLGREVVPEMLQDEAEPEKVARQAVELLQQPERVAAMRAGLAELRHHLGDADASRRAAEEVARELPQEVAV